MIEHHAGVFDLETRALIVCLRSFDLAQFQIQARPGSGRVVLGGDFRQGKWCLGNDGWPEQVVEQPEVSAGQVKAFAGRLLSYTDWKVARHRDQVDAGEPTSLVPEAFEALLAERQAIRDASNRIEAMNPIPLDYRDDRHWSTP